MAAPAVNITGLRSLAEAAHELQAIIARFVRLVDFPGGLGLTNAQIADAILPKVDAGAFDRHNQDDKIVEVHATFTAQNNAGQLFDLLVIWDADNPLAAPNVTQTAHFGWEIRLNNARVFGPGHVFFAPDIILPNYRMPDLRQEEVPELRLTKEGSLGNGRMQSVTRYYKLA